MKYINRRLRPNIYIMAISCAAIALSCTRENEHVPVSSDIPVTFCAETAMDNNIAPSSTKTDATAYFQDNDMMGVTAFWVANGGKDISATAPNFMYNQPVTYFSGAWTYSPVKYWPVSGSLNFYGYWPHSSKSDGKVTLSVNTDKGVPTLTYSNPDADIDLMAATAEGLTSDIQTSTKTVSLKFQHLLAKVRFSFTNGGTTKHVIHALRYNIPYIGIYKFSVPVSWDSVSEAPHELQRLTKEPEGKIINKTTFIDEFTSFILPCSLSKFDISINNVFVSYTPKEKIEIKSGHQYTINFVLNDDSSVFITSYSIWETDETIHEGKLQ